MESKQRREFIHSERKRVLDEVAQDSSRCEMVIEGEERCAQSNRKDASETVEEEMQERQELAENQARVINQILPPLLEKFSKIPDPRNPKKIKHQITTLLVYGILIFVFQIPSRRKANEMITKPIVWQNLRAAIPEFETMPHSDTLKRLLERIDCEEIQNSYESLLKSLIRKKKFINLLRNKKYVVAVDGSQKFYRDYQWQKEALQRRVSENGDMQYYTYVLESVIIFENGMVIPLLTEILENKDFIPGETKQDCERKAFKRLAARIYRLLGKNVILLGDGLYACEPIIAICRSYKWEYMISLKAGCLPDTWEEAECLIAGGMAESLRAAVGKRLQYYEWINGIGSDILKPGKPGRNVVFSTETWLEHHPVKKTGEERKYTTYAWLCSLKLTKRTVMDLCQYVARKRWCIENNNFHVEKHDGYSFEHVFSYDWNSMQGFHYLMKIGHSINCSSR